MVVGMINARGMNLFVEMDGLVKGGTDNIIPNLIEITKSTRGGIL